MNETADRASLLRKLGTPFLTDQDATHFTEFGYQFTYSTGEPDEGGKITRYTGGSRTDYQPGNLLAQFFSISNAKSTQVKIMVATVK